MTASVLMTVTVQWEKARHTLSLCDATRTGVAGGRARPLPVSLFSTATQVRGDSREDHLGHNQFRSELRRRLRLCRGRFDSGTRGSNSASRSIDGAPPRKRTQTFMNCISGAAERISMTTTWPRRAAQRWPPPRSAKRKTGMRRRPRGTPHWSKTATPCCRPALTFTRTSRSASNVRK